LTEELIKDGELVLNTTGEYESQRIMYHESCYLGRYQQEYKAPRALFNMVPGVELVEMDRNHDKSFCCGPGGGKCGWKSILVKELIIQELNRPLIRMLKSLAPIVRSA